MDLTDRNIKMCEKAIEIQQNHIFVWDDLYFDKFNSLVKHYNQLLDVVDEYSWQKWPNAIWLPRQYQIQEMYRAFIESELGTIEPDTKGVFLDFVAWMKEQYHESSHICVPTNNFSSGEQLWLACLMQAKYGKKWDGEDWVDEK